MAHLVALDGALSGQRFALDAPLLVGRGPYNHVVLDDARISRQHAKVSPEAGGHVLFDLNSANGTFVNDVQVRRHVLVDADVVRFGPFSFRFEPENEAARPRSRQLRTVRKIEELTRKGFEPPTKIVESLDASRPMKGVPMPTGLADLEDAERKLRALYELMLSLADTLDVSTLIERTVGHLFAVFKPAEQVACYLYDPLSQSMEPRLVMQRDGQALRGITLPDDIHAEVVQKGRAILSAPLTLTDEPPPSGGMMMHAPMLFGEEAHGVLNIRGTRTGAFSQADLDLFTAIAAHAAVSLQNARLHLESLKQQRLQQDLVLAEEIQKSFLPSQLPKAPGLQFAAEYRPAFSVGGDFYDVFALGPDRLGALIGDVSGKGVSAALLMARVSSDLRAAALTERSPARALSRVNELVCSRGQHDIFVTAIYLTIDLAHRRLTMANAGHLPPYLRRPDGQVLRIDGGASCPIGLYEQVVFEQVELAVSPGDTLCLFTDGIVEATDASGAQLGFDKVEEQLRAGPNDAGGLLMALLDGVRQHVGDAPQYDDLTVLMCGFG